MARLSLIVALVAVLLVFTSLGAPAKRRSVDKRIDQAEKNFEKKHGKDRRPGKGHLTELDILVPDELWKKQQKRSKRNALRYTSYHWPGGQVKYQIADHFTPTESATIETALDEWRSQTCLTFTNVGEEVTDKILFNKTGGCYSWIGMQGGSQVLSLGSGCVAHTVIIHEIGHAIGYFHEQSRPDRGDYITIHTENIQTGRENNFNMYDWDLLNNFTVGYDYNSAMHYGQYFFSSNGQPTITTTDAAYQTVIGDYEHLSYGDVKMANIMYACSAHCGSVSCPNGFVDKHCVCQCAGSPVTQCPTPTAAPTTAAPTTAAPTTAAPTTAAPTTAAPTTAAPTTAAPTTAEPTTAAPTTAAPTTAAPTTAEPTTAAPTTAAPTTAAPTTAAPTTAAPTTAAPTTAAPTTAAPTTAAPTTAAPTTATPTTAAPTTSAPTTAAPTTAAPTTAQPTTAAPTTAAPTTAAPTTSESSTTASTTASTTSDSPTTAEPTTVPPTATPTAPATTRRRRRRRRRRTRRPRRYL